MMPFLFAVFLTAAPACQVVDDQVMERHLQIVLGHDRDAGFVEMGILQNYWRTRCLRSRIGASKTLVRELAKALRRPDVRMLAADLLIDVGPNLRLSLPEIESALSDELRKDAQARRASRPIVPATYGFVADAMRCLKVKARTGHKDSVLCRPIERENASSDTYWAAPPR